MVVVGVCGGDDDDDDDDQGKERGPEDPVGLNGGLFVGM